ncbi:uncharacterized protein [Fopius arisanus]|uniref:Uncharacterized protein n=1 Tax=Fopius arisanus TaxID=64838 RepID=A0A9R1U6X1_9HYME|nr:PREDICTED: uncharacterized protein LOC105271074 [Fopius arisanus]
MILLICFVSLLTLGGCDELPSKLEIESSINRTIDEVERLMLSDPSLPRLSRAEIVDILQNITSRDMKNYEESIEQMRSDYKRALMVVLPYNSKDSAGEDLQDLYTKPPMVQVIPDSEIMLPFASIQEESTASSPRSSINLIEPSDKVNQIGTPQDYQNHRSSYSDAAPGSPEKFTFNLDDLPERKKNFQTMDKPKVQVVVSTEASSTHESTTPYVSSTAPTTYTSVNILTSDQWRYNAPPSTTSKPRTRVPSRTSTPSAPKKSVKASVKAVQVKPFLPTVISSVPTTSVTFTKEGPRSSPATDIATYDMTNIEMMNDAPAAVMYVTPMSSQSTRGQTTPMRKEVANLLAAIGLQPSRDKTKSKGILNEDILGEDFTMADSNLIPSKAALTSTIPDGSSILTQNTFEDSQMDLHKGVSNLSPDLHTLFQRFGLPVSGKEQVTTRKPEQEVRPPTKVDSWRIFKPIPTTEIKDEGMRDFLATFGLGEARGQKAMRTTTEASVIDAVPDRMKGILENIGLITRSRNIELVTTEKPKLHVFKPHETRIGDEEQKNKINELLDTVKLVQEGKAGVDDVRDAANRLLTTTKTLQGGPDPVSLEEILQMYNEDLRNEVKRQEQDKELSDAESDSSDNEMSGSDNTESTTSATSTTNATSSSDSSGDTSDLNGRLVESATDNSPTSEGPSLVDLADSFGGTTAAPDPVLPTPRRSGLYFLVDWNSFLEVGEEENKVNLRFTPKAGDGSRFIPVVVP